jgi:hypothetical protein
LFHLLQNNYLQHEKGPTTNHSIYGVEVNYKSVHMAIADWFNNQGSSIDLRTYVQCEEAYGQWKTSHYMWPREHMMYTRGKTDCARDPEPSKPTYSSTKERMPRLLSEVTAVAKISQIDSIPVGGLSISALRLIVQKTLRTFRAVVRKTRMTNKNREMSPKY